MSTRFTSCDTSVAIAAPRTPQAGRPSLPKNQHIVQHHVRKHRADAGREGNVSVPPAPQPGRQDRGKAHRREGERDNFEVDAPFGDDGSILCVQPRICAVAPSETPRNTPARHRLITVLSVRLLHAFFYPLRREIGR